MADAHSVILYLRVYPIEEDNGEEIWRRFYPTSFLPEIGSEVEILLQPDPPAASEAWLRVKNIYWRWNGTIDIMLGDVGAHWKSFQDAHHQLLRSNGWELLEINKD